MHCTEFLERYSDLRDGRVEGEQLEARLVGHLRGCPACTRYHAVVVRGVMALRALSDLEPSTAFRTTLHQRLTTDPPTDQPVMPIPARVMAAAMVVAAVLVFFTDASGPRQPAPLAGGPTERAAPVASFADLAVPAFGDARHAPEAQPLTGLASIDLPR